MIYVKNKDKEVNNKKLKGKPNNKTETKKN